MNQIRIQGAVIMCNECGLRIHAAGSGGDIAIVYGTELIGRTIEIETNSWVNVSGQLRLDLPGAYIIASDIQRVEL